MPTHSDSILTAALPHIPFDGWTNALLARAAAEANLPTGSELIAFPRGPLDAVAEYSRQLDTSMQSVALDSLNIPQKIEALLMARLKAMQNHLEASRAARRMLLLPWHSGTTTALLFETVNNMWRLSGVSDAGFSWYTRRLSLAYVLGTCVEYGLSDEGQNEEKLRAFIQRRLGDIAWIGKMKKKIAA